jgi:hypothetical protein
MFSRAGRLVSRFGPAVLLPPAAFAVHQLRYLLTYGSDTGVELRETGHSYLHSVVPWLVCLVALAAGCFLRKFGRALRGQTSARGFTVSFAWLWLICTVALVAIFACQESLEGIFAIGHPGGFAGVFGFGGWWAIPVSGCIGLVLAVIFHGARWLVQKIACRHLRRTRLWPGPAVRLPRPANAEAWAPVALAGGWSSRGPPA